MESNNINNNSVRIFNRAISAAMKQRRSGYEPSDTETEWNDDESLWNSKSINHNRNDRVVGISDLQRHNNISPIRLSRRANSSRFEFDQISTTTSGKDPIRRRTSSKSPYRPEREEVEEDENNDFIFHRKTLGPVRRFERKRQTSPYKSATGDQYPENRMIPKPPGYHRRAVTTPRMRPPSVGEINEMIANAKISKNPKSHNDPVIIQSSDSISQGDIFFSRDHTQNTVFRSYLSPKPKLISQSQRDHSYSASYQQVRRSSSTMTFSSSVVSGQSSKMSDSTGGTTTSMRNFVSNRKKSQSSKELWFACVRKGSCSTRKSPEERAFDEASFIGKASVVEDLRQFWADKYQPSSLDGFICHKQASHLLKQLVSNEKNCPYMLLKGPPGAGKRALTMAFLHELYGSSCWNVSHDLRHFQIPDNRQSGRVAVPLASSPHHVELNVSSEANSKYALMGLVKEISNEYALTIPDRSTVSIKPHYKVVVLYGVDESTEDIQHLIKWIMDCYIDVCRLILCCEDDSNILEPIKTRCKLIEVNAPSNHEIMEVLMQIAGNEGFDLSMSFALKIATKSNQNMRSAIMGLEACKAHEYPFVEEQPVPIGWDEAVMELAFEILANPSPTRLYIIKEKIQKLLVDSVHPKLILQRLVEQFLKRAEGSLKRELHYWHAYYNKRLPTGTSASLKLQEFVAKFMSIYRKSSSNFRYPDN